MRRAHLIQHALIHSVRLGRYDRSISHDNLFRGSRIRGQQSPIHEALQSHQPLPWDLCVRCVLYLSGLGCLLPLLLALAPSATVLARQMVFARTA